MEKILNIAILAHVDAGKTSLTENLLYACGAIKSLGSVDKGNTQTDYLTVEKERGITVQSAYTSLSYKNIKFNLIDTPGHVDFSTEVERNLNVIDAAILIISAVEGIQAHTQTLWKALQKRKTPVIIFINKIDRMGADVQLVINEIEKELSSSVAVLYNAENEGEHDVGIHSVWNENHQDEKTIENLANINESLLEDYIEGKNISFERADNYLKEGLKDISIYPIILGSARNSIGIREILDAMANYFPLPKWSIKESFSALVFGIEYDKSLGKMSLIKILSGEIRNRDLIFNQRLQLEEKITQLKRKTASSYEDLNVGIAGNILAIGGMSKSRVGDLLGKGSIELYSDTKMQIPLLTVQVKAINESDYPALAEALGILSAEDPALDFEWQKEDRELHIKIMGWMQMEILISVLKNRFNLDARFDEPTVIYKETPKGSGEGFVRYWMPKPCWAILKFKIEPAERGSGVTYKSELSVDKVHRKYQNEVERTIPQALKQGIKGWEVTDVKITLIDGEDHEIHSRPGDFVIATPMGIMQGLKEIGTALLEPLISFVISADEDLLGTITSDIIQMRGTFESPEMDNGKFILKGILPLSTSIAYPIKLSSRSGGRAKISTHFHAYGKCSNEQGEIREYKGISPLDTAKYILKARKALS